MNYDAEIIRSQRKTISVEITRELRVLVRAPWRMKTADIERFISDKAGWIDAHLEEMRRRNEAERAGREAVTPFTPEELNALVDKAKQVIPDRVAYFAPLVGVEYGRITIRNQRTRWGSCSAKGNLNFNCLLVLTPPEVLDYVVIHELCHLRELNHSPSFWAEVRRIMPDYADKRRWLKDNGFELIERLNTVK